MADTKAKGPLSGVLTRTLEAELAGGETLLGLQGKTGVHRGTISRYLSGERGLAVATIDKLLGYFQLEVRPRSRARRTRRGGKSG